MKIQEIVWYELNEKKLEENKPILIKWKNSDGSICLNLGSLYNDNYIDVDCTCVNIENVLEWAYI